MTKAVYIKGVLKQWGDRLYYQPITVRHVRNLKGGKKTVYVGGGGSGGGGGGRERLERTVKKAPEVMVKISGGGKNMEHIKAHMDYISRNGDVDIEDETGDIHTGKEAVRDVRDSWAKGGIGIPFEGEKRKEAFNIVLSMPAGTDRKAVKDAAREFASKQFDGHQYVFAAHEDEAHPHVHLAVKATSLKGIRLNPRKADLQRWRETFAEKLRDNGVDANATPRQLRGMTRKGKKQSRIHMDKRFKAGKAKSPAKVTVEQTKAAIIEARGGEQHINPHSGKIEQARLKTMQSYGTVARSLLDGTEEDRRLALKVTEFVKQLPEISTAHNEQVNKLKAKEPIQRSQEKRPNQRSEPSIEPDDLKK